jgi:hypothetical protein
MKHFIFCIIVIFCTTIGCSTIQCQANKQSPIVRIDIVSLSFDVTTRGALTFDHLLKSGDFRSILTDKLFLDSLDEQLHYLQAVSFDGYTIDHRVACIIFRENGQTDKLGLGKMYFTFNGKYYQQDNKIFLLIANRLPEDQRKVIYEYVRKKEEIEQQKANGTYKEKTEDWEKEQDE